MDFYGNAAQVLAIVLLALVLDTKYFDKEHMNAFKDRLIWKPWLIRGYSTFVASAAILGMALCLAVLAGRLSNSTLWRGIVGVGLGFALGSLLWRMIAHIWGRDDPTSEEERGAARKRREEAKKAKKEPLTETDS